MTARETHKITFLFPKASRLSAHPPARRYLFILPAKKGGFVPKSVRRIATQSRTLVKKSFKKMATVRKLQAEIDKTFRKVDEQQEVFQQIFDRLHECDQSLKEKYEVKMFYI